MDAYEYLKSLSHDSIPMSKLEEKELDEYCQWLAIMDAKKEGISEGKIEGEKSKQLEIAKKMLDKNIGISDISECTGLSVDEINNLKV